MKAAQENSIETIVTTQKRELLALKARQLTKASAMATKFSSASATFDVTIGTYGIAQVILKITLDFGDSGYFIGDFSVTKVRDSSSEFDEYFYPVNSPQTGDGKAIVYARSTLSGSSGETVSIDVSAAANGSQAGDITIELVKTS